ncbi:unnamed protein product [Parajaminaea phylloscopi]
MGGRKLTARTIKRKDQPTHPNSRRARQLERVALRDVKLSQKKSARGKTVSSKTDRLSALILMIPDELDRLEDLDALHHFISDSFLARRDGELQDLQSERRPGRPPSKQEHDLKESIAAERREYMENMEIPDLLNPTNVRLLREWDGDAQALGLYRMVRISGTQRDQYVQTQVGLHKDLALADEAAATDKVAQQEDASMQT